MRLEGTPLGVDGPVPLSDVGVFAGPGDLDALALLVREALAARELPVPGGPWPPVVEVGAVRGVSLAVDLSGAVAEAEAMARLALEMGAVLDLEIDRAGREACSVVLDHAFPPEGPARPAPRPCGDPPTGAARMRMYGSSPRDPEGGWAGLDSVELGSCRIVLDDEGDAEGLLELLGRVRRPDGPGVACQRLRSGRPVRLGHGDGGEPDLIVYPDAGEGA